MASEGSQLTALSRLFSSGVFRELAQKGRSPLFARLSSEAGVTARCKAGATVADAFEKAFSVLKTRGLRDEYVYRAALTHKILMGTHTLRTASMLTEFRAGECKADLVILNGTATVYEIKSERDTLSRLARQLENYSRVFAKTYVIASECHVPSVLAAIDSDVGVLSLSKRHQISTLREAAHRPDRVCPLTLLDSLRRAEACSVLLELGIAIPDVPNTVLHAALRDRFSRLDPKEVHHATVKVLKRTRDLAPLTGLVERLPPSLHAAALAFQLRRPDRTRLIQAVGTPLETATTWA